MRAEAHSSFLERVQRPLSTRHREVIVGMQDPLRLRSSTKDLLLKLPKATGIPLCITFMSQGFLQLAGYPCTFL